MKVSQFKSVLLSAIAVFALLLLSGWVMAAQAGSDPVAPESSGFKPSRISVGMGAVAFPDRPGASTYRAIPLPAIDMQWGKRARFGLIKGLRLNLLSGDKLFAGPIFRYSSGREARGAISDLDDVRGGFVTGGALRYEAGPVMFRTELQLPVSGDISGSQVEASAVWRGLIGGQRWIYTAGPSVTWISDKRADMLFGVNAEDASMLGVSEYEAGSGVSKVSFSITLTHIITEDLTVTGFAKSGYFLGDPGKSPLVDELGNRHEGFVGSMINWHF